MLGAQFLRVELQAHALNNARVVELHEVGHILCTSKNLHWNKPALISKEKPHKFTHVGELEKPYKFAMCKMHYALLAFNTTMS